MIRAAALFVLFLVPSLAFAATVLMDRSIEVSAEPEGNVYLTGGDVRIAAPLPKDLVSFFGTFRSFSPISGDVFLVGGTVDLSSPVAGDVRALAGHVRIDGEVAGDVATLGGLIRLTKPATDVLALGAQVELTGGAKGPVTIYGGSVLLSGEFQDDVHVVASDRVSVSPDTIIQGSLEYNAPQEASIPDSVVVAGGVHYVGSAPFLPTEEEARAYAIAGLGIFLMVRLVATLAAAGLIAGFFPVFATHVAERALSRSVRRFLLLTLLGFAVIVVTPVLILLLTASFVGIAIALLLTISYLLLLLLSYLYAAVIAGSALVRALFKRTTVRWHDAVLGMLVLFVIGIVPIIGFLVSLILIAAAAGTLVSLAYEFAFPKESPNV